MQHIPWQAFFGCYRKMGQTQQWKVGSKRSATAEVGSSGMSSGHFLFTIVILVLGALVVVLGAVALVRNVELSAFKSFCKGLISPCRPGTVPNGNNLQ